MNIPRNRAERRALAKQIKQMQTRIRHAKSINQQKNLNDVLESMTTALKLVSKPIKKIVQTKPEPKPELTEFDKIKATTDYIRNNPNINSNQMLSMNLANGLGSLIGDITHEFEPGEETEYYKISDSWDGNINTLISNVTMKSIDPTNEEAIEYFNIIENSSWGSEEKHEEALEKARRKAFKTNIAKIPDFEMSGKMSAILEDIMNSSEMWHKVADQYGLGTKAYESNDALEAWEATAVSIEELLNKNIKLDDFDELRNMIENDHTDIDDILKWVDNKIKSYM